MNSFNPQVFFYNDLGQKFLQGNLVFVVPSENFKTRIWVCNTKITTSMSCTIMSIEVVGEAEQRRAKQRREEKRERERERESTDH